MRIHVRDFVVPRAQRRSYFCAQPDRAGAGCHLVVRRELVRYENQWRCPAVNGELKRIHHEPGISLLLYVTEAAVTIGIDGREDPRRDVRSGGQIDFEPDTIGIDRDARRLKILVETMCRCWRYLDQEHEQGAGESDGPSTSLRAGASASPSHRFTSFAP